MTTIEVTKYNVDIHDIDFKRNGYKYFAVRISEFNGEDKEVGSNIIYVLDKPENDTIEIIRRYCVDTDNIDYLMLLPKNTQISLKEKIQLKILR